MSKIPLSIGIDVSKETLDITYKYQDNFTCRKIKNTKSEIQKVGRELSKLSFTGLIIVESTSHYHFLVALNLQQYNLDVRVINPILTQKYLRSNVRKLKTDKADSKILASIALLEKDLPAKVELTLTSAQIRLKISLIKALEKQIQSILGTIADFDEARENLGIESSAIEIAIKKTIKELRRKKELLEVEIKELIDSQNSNDVDGAKQILESIPGISAFMSNLLLFVMNMGYTAQGWVAYVGLDISVKQSGKWKARGKLTKRGSPYLRKRLFHSAWGAVMNNQGFKKLYYQLRQAGRQHTESLVIISRKLLKLAHALLRKNQLFDSNIYFAIDNL